MTQKSKKSINGKEETSGSNPKAVQKKYEEENFVDTSKTVWNYSILTDDDVTNYQNGTHYSLYKKFGSHSIQVNDVWGVYFCVWAPNASSVSVKGILMIGQIIHMGYIRVGIRVVSGKALFLVLN
jgi:1,4-alpha-glucan branching enzyme